MTLLDVVKKEVDASVWCDSIQWKGKRVTLKSDVPGFPEDDITGSKLVARWKRDLDAVHPRFGKVGFQIKQYGITRVKRETGKTHYCWATFEVVIA